MNGEEAIATAIPRRPTVTHDMTTFDTPRSNTSGNQGEGDTWTAWHSSQVQPREADMRVAHPGITQHPPPAATSSATAPASPFGGLASSINPLVSGNRRDLDAQVVAFHMPPEMRRSSGVLQHGMRNEAFGAEIPQLAHQRDRYSSTGWSTIAQEGSGGSGSLGHEGMSCMSVPSFGELPYNSMAGPSQQSTHGSSFPGVCHGMATPANLQQSTLTPPGLELDSEMPVAELNLLIKFLSAMGDLPNIELGDVSGRGETLALWRVAVETQLKQTRRVVVQWWDWVYGRADSYYKHWLTLTPLERNSVKIRDRPLRKFQPVEYWFYPRFLAVMPEKLKNSVVQ